MILPIAEIPKVIEDTKITKEGWMVPSVDSHLGKWIEEEGKLDHDNFLPKFFCNKMYPGAVVIDAGAFVGDHTVAYSKAVGKLGVVVAVEAGSVAYKCLKFNADRFEDKNVMPIQAALGEEGGKPVRHDSNENVGASHCVQLTEKELMEGGTYITTLAIDYIAGQLGKKINFIKLDIEGWEVKALIGAGNILKRDRPKLMIEVNSGALEKQGDSMESLYATLRYFDYKWSIIQPECKDGDLQYDIFCEPEPKIEILPAISNAVRLDP